MKPAPDSIVRTSQRGRRHALVIVDHPAEGGRFLCRVCLQPSAGNFRYYCGKEHQAKFDREVGLQLDWGSLRQAALARDGNACVACGRDAGFEGGQYVSLEVDHIKSVATHPELEFELDNLRTLCPKCHVALGARPQAGRSALLARAHVRTSLGDFQVGPAQTPDQEGAPRGEPAASEGGGPDQ